MAKTILVLFGGVSTEHIVSLRSAYNIISGLRQAGFKVVRAGITPKGEWLRFDGSDDEILKDTWQTRARQDADAVPAGSLAAIRSPRDLIVSLCGCEPDCIFPAVHGINCEDGSLQGLLTLTGFPYVGSGVLASASCMDKLHSKMIFGHARIPQARFIAVKREEIQKNPSAAAARVAKAIGFPCFLKPSNGGSSVGTCRVGDPDGLADALQEVSVFDRTVLAEEFIKAREIEVAVMGNEKPRTAVIGEVATSGAVDYYDYQAKYFMDNGAKIIVPADLPQKTAARIRRIAVKAYKAQGCAGLARVDFFLEPETGRILLNEINTLPGFTPISIYPKAFAATGIPLPKLVSRLCRLAIEESKTGARKVLI